MSFVGYLAIALVAAASSPRHEIFPFFCWFLFPLTPNIEMGFDAELLSIGGLELPEPKSFREAKQLVSAGSVDARFAVESLGAAHSAHPAELEHRRRWFEARFLAPPCRYRVTLRRYQPLRAFEGTADLERQVLGEYECGKAGPVPPGPPASGRGAARQAPPAGESR